MRSFCFVLLIIAMMTLTTASWAQSDEESTGNDDPGDIFAKSDAAEKKTEPDSKKSGSSETVMDEETVNQQTDASGQLVNADFWSLGGTPAWLDRNGLGAHVALGGYTCGREYCNTTLDIAFFGSFAATFGAYYRLTPNWSFFGDITISHLNTNFRNVNQDAGDNRGVAFQMIFGGSFHLPVKGWLDLYASLGIGPILLREKTDIDLQHNWGGFDIETALGADIYFWSVGFLKNFSVGPYMKIGFPIWAKVCEVTDVGDNCGKPSEMEDDSSYFWTDSPLTFQMGFEARYDFSIGAMGKSPKAKEKPLAPPSDNKAKDASKKEGDDNEKKAQTDSDETDAEASGGANWDM